MQHTYKIIILLSTFLCIPYYAGGTSYRTLTGHFSIPQKKIAYSAAELWQNVSGGWGYARSMPITMKIFNATFQPEVAYNKLVKRSKHRYSQDDFLKSAASQEFSPQKLHTNATLQKTSHLLGISIRGQQAIFTKNFNIFANVMPFTGILLEKKDPQNDTWPNKVYPVASIEAGFQGILSERLDWVFSGKYIYHPTQGEPRISVQLGGIYNV